MRRHERVIRSPAISGSPGSRLSATKDAPARSRACLDATPAAKPEIRAFDEAIQSGRQLRTALRLDDLEGDVVAGEHRVGHAKDARARVALERGDPALVGRSVHPESDEDAVVGTLLLERGIADTHDRHDDSQLARRP